MSVDVFSTTRSDERTGGPCPDWCAEEHLPPPSDDGIHCSEVLDVPTSQHRDPRWNEPEVICTNVHQHPGKAPVVILDHRDQMLASEDVLTPDEAVKVAEALTWNAEIIRACGNATCWCDGLHTPGDAHLGESKKVPVSLSDLSFTPDVTIAIVRYWGAPRALVHLVSHNERTYEDLTPDEADRLAGLLRKNASIARGEVR